MPYFTMADLGQSGPTTLVNPNTGETITRESSDDAWAEAYERGGEWRLVEFNGNGEPDSTSPGGSESPGAEESWWDQWGGQIIGIIGGLVPGGDEDHDTQVGQGTGGGGRPPMRAGMSPGVKNMLIITGSVAVLGGVIFFLMKD